MPDTEAPEVEAPAEEASLDATSQSGSLAGADLRMSPELLAQLAQAPAESEPEPEITAEQEIPAEPEAPTDLMPTWVNETLENPRAITKVPRSQQGAVIEAMKAQWLAQGNEHGRQMYAQGMQAAQEQAKQEARRAELETMQEDDPAGFVAWQRANPAEAAKFLQGMAVVPPSATGGIEAAAAAELAKLEAYPAAKAEIYAHPEKYPPTADGLRALVRDVALAEAKSLTPARQQAEQRQQAAERVKAAPKADVAGGASAIKGAVNLAKLKDLPFDEQMKALEGVSREDINRALRG